MEFSSGLFLISCSRSSIVIGVKGYASAADQESYTCMRFAISLGTLKILVQEGDLEECNCNITA
jgi:hypothetical protein